MGDCGRGEIDNRRVTRPENKLLDRIVVEFEVKNFWGGIFPEWEGFGVGNWVKLVTWLHEFFAQDFAGMDGEWPLRGMLSS